MKKTEKSNQGKVLEKKKIAAEIKIDYNKKQTENLEREIEHKDEIYNHLCEKYSNKELYGWLKKETGTIYKTLFQLAVKVARKAEKCYHFEIGDTEENPKTAKTFIKGSGSYWNGLRSGLLAGEKLLADLHAMEVAYLENDRNELEITKDIYLDELDDMDNNCSFLESLNSLEKEVQNFRIEISKDAFDFTHYFGRIRDVKIQVILKVPSSHRNISAELSLTKDKLWLNEKDFIVNRVGIQTIATSKAHLVINQFDFNFSKDKYCPFEGAGIDSEWSLSIPGVKGNEIANVIISVSYTARKGV